MILSQVRFIHSINYFTRGTNVQKTSLTSQDDTLELTEVDGHAYVKVGNALYVPLTNVSVFMQDMSAAAELLEMSVPKNKGGRPPKNSLATNGANKETSNS